jgi:hypothetical protein
MPNPEPIATVRCQPDDFAALRLGTLRCLLVEDVGYAVGRKLYVQECKRSVFTGRATSARVSYVLRGAPLPETHCVVSLARIWPHQEGDDPLEGSVTLVEQQLARLRLYGHPPGDLEGLADAFSSLHKFLPVEPPELRRWRDAQRKHGSKPLGAQLLDASDDEFDVLFGER